MTYEEALEILGMTKEESESVTIRMIVKKLSPKELHEIREQSIILMALKKWREANGIQEVTK